MKETVQIDRILGNAIGMRLLKSFLDNPSLKINQNTIIKNNKIAKATAVKWLKLLVEKRYLNLEKIGTTNLYSLNNPAPKVKQLKILYTLLLLEPLNIDTKMWLYGSCARGENMQGSDIDLLILSNKKRADFVNKIEEFSEKIGKNINYLCFSDLEWSMMADKDKAFFDRVEKDRIEL